MTENYVMLEFWDYPDPETYFFLNENHTTKYLHFVFPLIF